TPSKDRIYREYMPDGYPIVNEENRTDLLAAYLQSHTTVPVVWRYDMLRSQARQNADRLLYYKTDTHWNAVGALIGLDGIFEALDMPTRPADSYPVEAGGTTTGDMANVAALYASLPAEETYVVPGYDRMFEKDSRTVRVIGDSFSEYYMPYLQARFTNSWREHIDTFTMDVAGHPGCDILILEFNERSLDKLLAILEQF
ncbi:MAG: alginate O-acetyltransferase AlgX-related protein, partial [Gemmiger formicilis]